VKLEPWQIRHEAEVGGLPSDWIRYTDRPEVIERRAKLKNFGAHDEIMTGDSLQQLVDANVLDHTSK
jgi:hypothetical protein